MTVNCLELPSVLTPTTTSDVWDLSDDELSLREAVYQANQCQDQVNEIALGNGRHELLLEGAAWAPDTEFWGDLDIYRRVPLKISGGNWWGPNIDANGIDRVMEIHSGATVELQNVLVTDGRAQDGGGVYNSGSLTLTNAQINGNQADRYGGAIFNTGVLTVEDSSLAANLAGGYGGGIFNNGDVVIDNSYLYSNCGGVSSGCNTSGRYVSSTDSPGHGGGIFNNTTGSLTLTNGTSVMWNGAFGSYGHGGGIFNNGSVTVENSGVTGNVTQGSNGGYGGGMFNNETGAVLLRDGSQVQDNRTQTGNANGYGHGGGIYNQGLVTIDDSDVSNNQTDAASGGYGGGIFNDADGDLYVQNGSSVVNNHAQENGLGYGHGGGIFNKGWASLVDSLFSDNVAHNGHGGAAYNQGTLEAGNSLSTPSSRNDFRGNHADRYGGAIFVRMGEVDIDSTTIDLNTSDQHGGGIAVFDGTADIVSSTISNNATDLDGGGIYVTFGRAATANLVNSTLSGNTSRSGGGVYNGHNLNVTNSTIAYNGATGGGGFGIFNQGNARLFNSIVAHNFHATTAALDDLGGELLHDDSSHNLIGEQLANTDVALSELSRLGGLADNGGPTATHELRLGSVAIDAGDDALARSIDGGELTKDQTERDRKLSGDGNGMARVDIGATEFRRTGF